MTPGRLAVRLLVQAAVTSIVLPVIIWIVCWPPTVGAFLLTYAGSFIEYGIPSAV